MPITRRTVLHHPKPAVKKEPPHKSYTFMEVAASKYIVVTLDNYVVCFDYRTPAIEYYQKHGGVMFQWLGAELFPGSPKEDKPTEGLG